MATLATDSRIFFPQISKHFQNSFWYIFLFPTFLINFHLIYIRHPATMYTNCFSVGSAQFIVCSSYRNSEKKLLDLTRCIQSEAHKVLQSDSTKTIDHIQKCFRQKFQCSRRPSYSTTLFFLSVEALKIRQGPLNFF